MRAMLVKGVIWRLGCYLRLARFDKPVGTLLLLWPTLWGLWAVQSPPLYWVVVFTAGAVVMRALGCVINDMADRRLDRQVSRTRTRPLAAGDIVLGEAAALLLIFALAALLLLLLLPLRAQWWCGAALALALVYPFAKRFLALPQLVLAAAFSIGIVIADITVTGARLPSAAACCLVAANMLWVMGYDTIYAMVDRRDDAAVGTVGSSALLLGRRDVAVVSMLYAACLLLLSATGIIFNYGIAYQVALIAAMVCVFRFWQKYKTRDERACLAAFRANHWLGVFVLAGLIAAQQVPRV